MSASIYSEKVVQPNELMLEHDLDQTKNYLDQIERFIEGNYSLFNSGWKYYNQKSGWILKMFSGKRNVLFIVPCDKYFRVVFTLGNNASHMVFNSALPDAIKSRLFEAKKYIEGRTIHLDVKTETDLGNVLQLIRFKMTH